MELEEVQKERKRISSEMRMYSAYVAVGEMIVERTMMRKAIIELLEDEAEVSPQFLGEVH